jgi:transposase-like protein
MSGTSYRVDETYIKVGKTCNYLYRAVDKEGNTIEFMLSAIRYVSAAKRFFKKLMRSDNRRLPFSISVDKNAAYPEAFSTSQSERVVPKDCKLRRVKYLNNVTLARPPLRQEEGASIAMLQEFSHRRTNTGRH